MQTGSIRFYIRYHLQPFRFYPSSFDNFTPTLQQQTLRKPYSNCINAVAARAWCTGRYVNSMLDSGFIKPGFAQSFLIY